MFRYLSDVHRYVAPGDHLDDILLMPGDLCEHIDLGRRQESLIRKYCTLYKEVIFTPGNHEYYAGSIESVDRFFRKLAEDIPNFTFLQGGESVIRGGVKIIGATLWTFMTTEEQMIVRNCMMDYYRIEGSDGETLEPEEVVEIHKKHVAAINKEILEADGLTIVMSHHAPSTRSIADQWIGNAANPGFCSNIELDAWPTYWIHGHTHTAMRYNHKGCEVICNPIGYPGEGTGYDIFDNVIKL